MSPIGVGVLSSAVFAYGETPWGSPTNLGNLAPSSIWVVAAHGGTPVQVTDAQSLNTSPVWLPGGRGLLFVSNRDGGRDVYQMDLDRRGAPAHLRLALHDRHIEARFGEQ